MQCKARQGKQCEARRGAASNARRGKARPGSARRGAVSVAAVAVGNRVLGSAGRQWAEMRPTEALQECTDNTTLYFLVDIIHFRMVPPCCSALLCSALRCAALHAPIGAEQRSITTQRCANRSESRAAPDIPSE